MIDVLVCCTAQERERLLPLTRALRRRGWRVGRLGVQPTSARLSAPTLGRVGEAAAVVVAWTRDSVALGGVLDAAEAARARGALVPMLVDPVRPRHAAVPPRPHDLTRWEGGDDEPCWQELARHVDRLVARRALDAPPRPSATSVLLPVTVARHLVDAELAGDVRPMTVDEPVPTAEIVFDPPEPTAREEVPPDADDTPTAPARGSLAARVGRPAGAPPATVPPEARRGTSPPATTGLSWGAGVMSVLAAAGVLVAALAPWPPPWEAGSVGDALASAAHGPSAPRDERLAGHPELRERVASGWAALERGRLDAAIVHLGEALELDPASVDAAWGLGLVELRRGRGLAASGHLCRAMAGVSPAEREGIREVLEARGLACAPTGSARRGTERR